MPCGQERKRIAHPPAPERVAPEKPADPPPVAAPYVPGEPYTFPPSRREIPVGLPVGVAFGSDAMLKILGMTREEFEEFER